MYLIIEVDKVAMNMMGEFLRSIRGFEQFVNVDEIFKKSDEYWPGFSQSIYSDVIRKRVERCKKIYLQDKGIHKK